MSDKEDPPDDKENDVVKLEEDNFAGLLVNDGNLPDGDCSNPFYDTIVFHPTPADSKGTQSDYRRRQQKTIY